MGWAGGDGTWQDANCRPLASHRLPRVNALCHIENTTEHWRIKCRRCGKGWVLNQKIDWDSVLHVLEHVNECMNLKMGY